MCFKLGNPNCYIKRLAEICGNLLFELFRVASAAHRRTSGARPVWTHNGHKSLVRGPASEQKLWIRLTLFELIAGPWKALAALWNVEAPSDSET